MKPHIRRSEFDNAIERLFIRTSDSLFPLYYYVQYTYIINI